MATSTSDINPTKSKRRRLQFGLRSMLIAVLVCCLGFGWLARQLQKARERQAIVAQLDNVGVYVYQYEPTALGRLTRTSESFDDWLRTRFGDSLLSTPSAISAHRLADGETEYLIRQLRQFPGLRTLHIGPLSEENEERLQTAFPHVDVETARGFGPQPSVGVLQPAEP